MSVVGNRIRLGLLGAGSVMFGLALGQLGNGPSRGGLPREDGAAVFGVVSEGRLASGWADVRVSAGRRSMSLLVGKDVMPQLLVFPKAGNWPAMLVPVGWVVGWLTGEGVVVETQSSRGQPLVPKGTNILGILALPGDSPCKGGLIVGKKVFWGPALVEGACPVG